MPISIRDPRGRPPRDRSRRRTDAIGATAAILLRAAARTLPLDSLLAILQSK
jgi:hypothetical protein